MNESAVLEPIYNTHQDVFTFMLEVSDGRRRIVHRWETGAVFGYADLEQAREALRRMMLIQRRPCRVCGASPRGKNAGTCDRCRSYARYDPVAGVVVRVPRGFSITAASRGNPGWWRQLEVIS